MASEKRLIADALKKYHNSKFTPNIYEHSIFGKAALILESDALEVVHGYWHIDDYDGGEPDAYAAFIEVHCSQCGYELGAESGQYGWAYGDPFPLNYCPNCGAKMDGERKDND